MEICPSKLKIAKVLPLSKTKDPYVMNTLVSRIVEHNKINEDLTEFAEKNF